MKVTHFIRKYSQLKASFIQNQILSHISYEPNIVYKIKTDKGGGFAKFDSGCIEALDLSKSESLSSRLKFKFIKLICTDDSMRISHFVKESDILHFHFGTDAGIYLPILKHIEKPKVVSFYGYDCSSFPKRFLGFGKYYLKRRVFKHADIVLAMSKDMEDDLLKLGCPKEKIRIHYHGVPLVKFYNEHLYQRPSEVVTFLIITGLTPKKGHLFLLSAFKIAYSINPNIKLIIVGSGITYTSIMDFINKNEMHGYVDMTDKTVYASEQHLNYFKSADVFIHPSITHKNADKEGIPGAIVEAMAAGLPVISTYHAGIPSIIKNEETGILVSENDIKALCDAIIRISSDRVLRQQIGICSQKQALEHLDILTREMYLENIYTALI